MSECPGEHTEYQPTDDEWKCPKCGAGVEDFRIVAADYPDCDKLHTTDIVTCHSAKCMLPPDYFPSQWTGRQLAFLLMMMSTNPKSKARRFLMDADYDWGALFDRIESGMTTCDDADVVRDLREQVIDLETELSKFSGAFDADEEL